MAVLSGRVLHDLDYGIEVKATRNDSPFRKWFDFIFTPTVHLRIEFSADQRPCMDCYAGIEEDLQDLFGADCLSPSYTTNLEEFDPRDWMIEADILDPVRHNPLLGSAYDEVIERVKVHLDACSSGDHYTYAMA